MSDDLLQAAILKIKREYLPRQGKSAHIPEPYVQLYEPLQIFNTPDEETVGKVKFIYEYLTADGGEPIDKIISIHTRLGAIANEDLSDRVYKYCKLMEASTKAKQRWKNLEREINALHNTRRPK